MLPTDIEVEHISNLEDIRLSLVSVYDKSPVIIWFSDKDDTKILTENMDLAGDLIHSLANFLNIEDLKVKKKEFRRLLFPFLYTELVQHHILDHSKFSQYCQSTQSILWTN